MPIATSIESNSLKKTMHPVSFQDNDERAHSGKIDRVTNTKNKESKKVYYRPFNPFTKNDRYY